jgi:hypothetical protein
MFYSELFEVTALIGTIGETQVVSQDEIQELQSIYCDEIKIVI